MRRTLPSVGLRFRKTAIGHLLIILTLASGIGAANLVTAPAALADLACYGTSSPGTSTSTCYPKLDTTGDSRWCNAFSAAAIHNAAMRRCLRSLMYVGTGDNLRYMAFDIEVNQTTDPANDEVP